MASIYESIGRNLGDVFVKGTPTASTGSTFESNVLINPDARQLVGKEVYWDTGLSSKQARLVASFSPANNRIIHEQGYTVNPTGSDTFLIFNNFRADDYDNAITRAIGKVRSLHLDDYVATLSIIATQYEYSVASGMEFISTLRFVPSNGSDYDAVEDIRRVFELSPRFWRIEGNQGGSRIIAIDPRQVNLSNYDGQICRVEGQAKPDLLVGTTVDEDLQDYVINYSSMILAAQKDGNEWARRYYMFRDEIKGRNSIGLEDSIFTHPRGRKVNS